MTLPLATKGIIDTPDSVTIIQTQICPVDLEIEPMPQIEIEVNEPVQLEITVTGVTEL